MRMMVVIMGRGNKDVVCVYMYTREYANIII